MKIWKVAIRDTVPPVGDLFAVGTPVVRQFTVLDFKDSNEDKFRRSLEARYGKERVIDFELGD